MINYPVELNKIKEKGFNMSGFVPLLYSLMTEYRNGQKGLRTVLEIGVRGGTSTNSFLYGLRDRIKKHPHMQLYSIDIKDCSSVVKDETLKPYWTFIHGDSKEVVWDKEIDILLIDSDHSFAGIKADYEKYEPFVKENGLILAHDVNWPKKSIAKYFWDYVKYPKIPLSLSKSGMGIIFKKMPPYYKDDLIEIDNTL